MRYLTIGSDCSAMMEEGYLFICYSYWLIKRLSWPFKQHSRYRDDTDLLTTSSCRFNLQTWRGSAIEKTCTLTWRKVILGRHNYNWRCVIFWFNLCLAEKAFWGIPPITMCSAKSSGNNSRIWAATTAATDLHAIHSRLYSKARDFTNL